MAKATKPKQNTKSKPHAKALEEVTLSQQTVSPFTWSFSRHDKFAACRRAYLFHYYVSQNGWLATAHPVVKRAYELKKMSSLPLWKGALVHGGIERYLVSHKARKPVQVETLISETLAQADKDWKHAQQAAKVGTTKGKGLRLMELELKVGKAGVTEHDLNRLRMDVETMLRAFLESDTLQEILSVGVANWLTIEQLAEVRVAEVPCYVKVDFAYRQKDGTIRVLDWKTGKVYDGYTMQLKVYAVTLAEMYGVDLKSVKLTNLYLGSNGESRPVDYPPLLNSELAQINGFVLRSVKPMAKALKTSSGGDALPHAWKDYPRINSEGKFPCTYCAYNELCYNPPFAAPLNDGDVPLAKIVSVYKA